MRSWINSRSAEQWLNRNSALRPPAPAQFLSGTDFLRRNWDRESCARTPSRTESLAIFPPGWSRRRSYRVLRRPQRNLERKLRRVIWPATPASVAQPHQFSVRLHPVDFYAIHVPHVSVRDNQQPAKAPAVAINAPPRVRGVEFTPQYAR
ncbi:hypothetical protein BKA62DRAFT_767509 [Auriculariales sp. MPI-PUGE-AT-0066]|nr:hypothetical protein BKA62DRAFT_767509 [Auriculariales sp. MPI-PUGE-AT-0066]